MIFCLVLPGIEVNFGMFEVSFYHGLETEFRAYNLSLDFFQLPIQNILWNWAILHPSHIAQPAKATLAKMQVNTEQTSLLKNLNISHLVLALYTKDLSEASHMKGLLVSFCCEHLLPKFQIRI